MTNEKKTLQVGLTISTIKYATYKDQSRRLTLLCYICVDDCHRYSVKHEGTIQKGFMGQCKGREDILILRNQIADNELFLFFKNITFIHSSTHENTVKTPMFL